MGKSTTPKYVIVLTETRNVDGRWKGVQQEPMAWNTKTCGRPTTENLEKFVRTFGKSLEAGGVNAHLSDGLGYIPYPTKAIIRHNHSGGATVAEWVVPAFMVW